MQEGAILSGWRPQSALESKMSNQGLWGGGVGVGGRDSAQGKQLRTWAAGVQSHTRLRDLGQVPLPLWFSVSPN